LIGHALNVKKQCDTGRQKTRRIGAKAPIRQRKWNLFVVIFQICKFCVLVQPLKFDGTGWTITLLTNNNLGDSLFGRSVFCVIFIAVQKHNNVGILLNRSRFTQIRKNWSFVLTFFYFTAELGKRNYRAVQFTCQRF